MKKELFPVFIVMIFPAIFFLFISCASIKTADPAAMSMYIEEEYSLLIEVNSAAVAEGKFDDITLEIDGKRWEFKVEPLFPWEDTLDDLIGYRDTSHWLILTYVAKEGELKEKPHPWSLAHRFIQKVKQALHEHIITIEADIHHHWYFDDFRKHLYMPSGCSIKGPSEYWPYIKEFAWHLDDNYSQLRSAREYVAANNPVPVRIAHLDTGYDPTEITYPAGRMLLDLAYNFYEDNTNAEDPGLPDLFGSAGHGTGTLGFLAGKNFFWPSHYGFPNFNDYLGANITADIVPVRIYPSVVHFKTHYMAQGILYAISPGGDINNICNVVTLSAGGVASRAWADAVNLAYEAGVAIFAASGDRYGISPPATTVYPARFHRVVSVCGATSDYTPYYKKNNLCKVQESFGPDKVMDSAIAGFAPNVPWAKYKCGNIFYLDGGGTSASTPQVAGAAALWLEMYGNSYDNDWTKVEAVRTALFKKAKKEIPGMTDAEVFTYFGNGVLKAMDALNYEPEPDELAKQPEDKVVFPLITLLIEYFESFFKTRGTPESLWKKLIAMYELEMVQLHMGDSRLQKIIKDHETNPQDISENTLKKYVKAVSTVTKASDELKVVMKYIYNEML